MELVLCKKIDQQSITRKVFIKRSFYITEIS